MIESEEKLVNQLDIIRDERAQIENLYEVAKTSRINEVRILAGLVDRHETNIWFALQECYRLMGIDIFSPPK